MQQRQVGQMGPNVVVCPNCHTPKDPQQLVCLVCNTRSCPNGHILSASARICHVCDWVDRNWKQQPIIHQQLTKTVEKSGEVHIIERCPHCGAAIDPKMQTCGFCGSVISATEMEQESVLVKNEPVQLPKVEMRTIRKVKPASLTPIENKAEYVCPSCNSKVDDPSSGQCNFCGHTGSFIVNFSKQTTQNTQTSQRNVPQTTVQRPPVQYTRVSPPQVAPPPPKPPATQIYCHQCGAPNPSNARFCRTCGNPLVTDQNIYQTNTANIPVQPIRTQSSIPTYLERTDSRANTAAPSAAPPPPPPQEIAKKMMSDREYVPAQVGPLEKTAGRRGNPYLIITAIILVAIVIIFVFLYISRI